MERSRAQSNQSVGSSSPTDAARPIISSSGSTHAHGPSSSGPASPEKPRTAPTSIFSGSRFSFLMFPNGNWPPES
jgi:hypothetical protein